MYRKFTNEEKKKKKSKKYSFIYNFAYSSFDFLRAYLDKTLIFI